jgi:hypothetical protein
MLFYQAVAEDYNEPEEDGKKQSRLSFSTTDLATLIFLVDVSVQYTFLLLFKANFDWQVNIFVGQNENCTCRQWITWHSTICMADNPPASVAATPAANVEPTESEGSEPPLNEDDDDDDVDDADHGDEEPATNHLVLAQFDKVSSKPCIFNCCGNTNLILRTYFVMFSNSPK